MSGTTTSGWPYVTPDDHPVEYPAASQALANLLEARSRIVVAAKGADQTGIASGGSAGFSATLTGLTVGQEVLVAITAVSAATSATVPAAAFLQATVTGGTVAPTLGPQQTTPTASGQAFQTVFVGRVTATASTVTVSYTMTFSNANAWTCFGRSAIVLLAP